MGRRFRVGRISPWNALGDSYRHNVSSEVRLHALPNAVFHRQNIDVATKRRVSPLKEFAICQFELYTRLQASAQVPGEFSARNWYCAARVVENVPSLRLVPTGDPVPLRHPQAQQEGLQRRLEKHDGIDRA